MRILKSGKIVIVFSRSVMNKFFVWWMWCSGLLGVGFDFFGRVLFMVKCQIIVFVGCWFWLF